MRLSSLLFSFWHSKPGPFLVLGLLESRTLRWCENVCHVQSDNRNKCLVSCDQHGVFLLKSWCKDADQCHPVYILSTPVHSASHLCGWGIFSKDPMGISQRTANCGSWCVFLLGWVCFVWGFKFFPSSPKMDWKDWEGWLQSLMGRKCFIVGHKRLKYGKSFHIVIYLS